MKTLLRLPLLILLLLALTTPGWALWDLELVTPQRARELGLSLKLEPAGTNQPGWVRVSLEFKTAGALREFARAELEMSSGGRRLVSASLESSRPAPDRVVISFFADRDTLATSEVTLFTPSRGMPGVCYQLKPADFVTPEKPR